MAGLALIETHAGSAINPLVDAERRWHVLRQTEVEPVSAVTHPDASRVGALLGR